MSRDLLIAVSPGELRAVLVAAGRAADLRIERLGEGSRVGEIHLGRIVALLPALPAALVEIGLERLAFLSAEDAIDAATPEKRMAGIAAWLTEGEAVMVQVMRDAQGEKAVGVSLRLRLRGRLLTLTPTRPKIVLPRGTAPETRRRMEALLATRLTSGEGVVLHADACDAEPEAVLADLAALRARWAALEDRARQAEPPALLDAEEGPLARLLAAYAGASPDRILIDDMAALAEARAWLGRHHPDLVARVSFEAGEADIFERHGVAEDLAGALARRVALPGEAALIIETNAAMSTIDVDGGRAVTRGGEAHSAALGVNLAAAVEAARQIRLRNLSGAIVIDFISMERRADRAAIIEALAGALAGDPGEPRILGWTRLGHVELTRRRRHKPLAEIVFDRSDDAGPAKNAVTVALEALREAARQAAHHPARAPRLTVHPAIAAALEGLARAALRELEARLARPVVIVADAALGRETFDIGFD